MKAKPLADSLAAVTAVAWIVCTLFIWLFPGFSLYITRTWLMGLQGVELTGFSLDVQTFIVGGISAVVTAWFFGYAWGWFHQKFSKR